MRRSVLVVAFAAICAGCVNLPRNYEPAGFASAEEAWPYVNSYQYFASRLTADEWSAFYRRFPEYFRDMDDARRLGSTMEYHPWYSAYAFRWTTLKRRENWPPEVLARLDRKEVVNGDDVFQVVYALGPPARIVWNNDGEALLYSDSTALVMDQSILARKESCAGCRERLPGNPGKWKLNEDRVLRALKIATTR